MKLPYLMAIILFAAILGCSRQKAWHLKVEPGKDKVFAKEPDDSASYRHLKYDFYLSRNGHLFERKLVVPRDSTCNCQFIVYYDRTLVDINSFVPIDPTDFSKDKNHVFYFYGNSDGGNRVIVEKADPVTFKRLCEYRWGIDGKQVFYESEELEGLDLKHLRVLYPPDTADYFVQYVKDDKMVYFENRVVKGADANSFKVVSGRKWDAEDRYYKYQDGRRLE